MQEQRGTPPRFTKACIGIGLLAVAVFAYGIWMVKASHESTGEISSKIKSRQIPSVAVDDNRGLSESGNHSMVKNKGPLSAHTQRVLSYVDNWLHRERRGQDLVLSDSICYKMKPPTEQTDVKAYPGVRVEEMSDLVDHFPAIVAGYRTIILHLGTNNLYARDNSVEQSSLTRFPAKDIHRLYNELCSKIRTINPNCVIYSSAILPRQVDPDLTYDKLTEVNSLLEAEFGQRFIHSESGFADTTNASGKKKLEFKKELFSHDGLHLTNSGKQFLSDKFSQVLTKM